MSLAKASGWRHSSRARDEKRLRPAQSLIRLPLITKSRYKAIKMRGGIEAFKRTGMFLASAILSYIHFLL